MSATCTAASALSGACSRRATSLWASEASAGELIRTTLLLNPPPATAATLLMPPSGVKLLQADSRIALAMASARPKW
jgi:hypothetical protein